MANALSFPEFIAGLRVGDNRAVAELQNYATPVVGPVIRSDIARFHLHRFVDWDDVFQDVLVEFTDEAKRGAFQLEDLTAVLALLMTMGRHRVVDLARHYRRDERAFDHSAQAEQRLAEALSRLKAPEIMTEVWDYLFWLLPQSPDPAKEIAWRRAWGQDWHYIERAMGRPADVLRKSLDRGLDHLRIKLHIVDPENWGHM